MGWAGMTGQDEDGDPLLVRPYILSEPGVPAPRSSAETWPEPAPAPPAHAAPGAAGPVATHQAPVPLLRRRRVLLACLLALALTAASGLAFALRPETGPPAAGLPERPLPTFSAIDPAADPDGGTFAPSGSAQSSSAPIPRTRTTTSTPAATSATTTPATRPATSAVPSRAAPTPAPTLSPVPAAARVGTIGADGGLCLDLNGGVAVDDNHVQVFECNGTTAQVWTLATDGTLRVVDKCAQVAADGTVHITGCDNRDAAQWRAGRNQALVNVATNDCLTDPAAGTRSGAGVQVADCAGASNQQWRLP
jgi:ricin-type beta-trefoil lectin protein